MFVIQLCCVDVKKRISSMQFKLRDWIKLVLLYEVIVRWKHTNANFSRRMSIAKIELQLIAIHFPTGLLRHYWKSTHQRGSHVDPNCVLTWGHHHTSALFCIHKVSTHMHFKQKCKAYHQNNTPVYGYCPQLVNGNHFTLLLVELFCHRRRVDNH